ncbi:MAG: PilN domain-containing protein [Candidatus Omnitrophica bacterium]|nr:PilN domain-containing protein [Candidatus Omnitrophota bacterium]
MKKAITAIEITSTDIKLFQSRMMQGKDVITFCDVYPVNADSDEEVINRLKEMMSSLPDRVHDPFLVVPRRNVILRQVKFPSDDLCEIEDMIGLQLLDKIPYPVEDVIYRHLLLDKDDQGFSRILVAIIQKSVVNRYYRIMHRAGIKEGRLTLSCLGVLGWLNYQKKMRKNLSTEPIALLNIDARNTEICFCSEGKLFFSRNILYGRECLRSRAQEEFIKEIRLSLEAYHKDHLGPCINKVLILSKPSEGAALSTTLEAACGRPVEMADPLDGIFCAVDVKGNPKSLGETSIIAPAGIMLSDTKHWVNLSPREVHDFRRKKSERRRLAGKCMLLVVAVSLIVCGQVIDIHKKCAYLRSLKDEISRLQPGLEEIARKKQLAASFDRRMNNFRFIPELMDELNHLTPVEVTYRTLSLDQKRNVWIQGYAETHADITEFQARLIQSSCFSDVDLKFATKRTMANKPVMDFKIALQLGHNQGDGL